MVLDKILESPLGYKEVKLISLIGIQPWLFIGRIIAESEVPIPDAKGWLIGKDPDAGKNWRQEEKRAAQDKIVG